MLASCSFLTRASVHPDTAILDKLVGVEIKLFNTLRPRHHRLYALPLHFVDCGNAIVNPG
jgi:hypothetical protein